VTLQIMQNSQLILI